MDLVKRWAVRLGSVGSAAALAVLVPAMAWASSHPDVIAVGDELVRRRRRGGFGALLGLPALCCCLVVAAIVVGVVMIVRRRRRPPPPPQY
jgi:hypothetical protein